MAIAVCSSAFVGLGHMQRRAMGVPELPVAVITHPFGVLDREQVREQAERCLDDILRLLGPGGRP